MIWVRRGDRYWITTDYNGYVAHARSKLKPKAKNVLDTIPESWVTLPGSDKKLAHFKKERHILDAMDQATKWVKNKLDN